MKKYLLFAWVDGAGGEEPALDPHTFSLMEVTILKTGLDDDGLPGAWVRLDDGAESWYEDRFLLSVEQLQALRIPSP